jgi:hypothetical protein
MILNCYILLPYLVDKTYLILYINITCLPEHDWLHIIDLISWDTLQVICMDCMFLFKVLQCVVEFFSQ